MKWRTDPQALTYGVLVPETHMFTVRWAIKPNDSLKTPKPPTCAFEWYTYTDAEVDHWRNQLLEIAQEIRWNRLQDIEHYLAGAFERPWRTNFGNCYRYGVRYACPFIEKCAQQKWGDSMGKPRTPHLAIEREIKLDKQPDDLVILDASRVDDYLGCPEQYRRKWEGEGFQEESEALTIGTDFHSLIAGHIKEMIHV